MIQLKDPSTTEELPEVVQRVIARFCPEKILLYGSFAYGNPHADSDFDLLVVLPNPPAREVGWEVARELRLNHRLEMVFMSTQEFEETKDVVGGLAYPANHWGKVLHESAS
jgi:predicted nucleotidyltransferase